jgi:hypothetical protein
MTVYSGVRGVEWFLFRVCDAKSTPSTSPLTVVSGVLPIATGIVFRVKNNKDNAKFAKCNRIISLGAETYSMLRKHD